MISNVKAILELLKIVLAAYRFMSDEMDEIKFRRIVRERKKVHQAFAEADRVERLKILRDRIGTK